jgi:hypothetical protein
MKNEKKTHWLRTTILVLVACGIVGLTLSAVLFFRDPGPTYASATLVLTFDGAAAGIAPNGVPFNLRELNCDEVLSEGLKAAALEGSYTPEQIRPSLTVRGVYPDAMAEQVMHYESLLNFTTSRELTVGDYHPTTFGITLTNDFDKSISRDQLTALLKGITEAYRSYFSRVYAYGLDTDSTIFKLEDYDYPQQLQIIEGRLSSVSAYAQELYEKDPAFRFRGAGFNDISVRLNNLIDSSITRLSADLTINALTRDTERMLTQYQYQILDLGIQREKQNQELNKLDKLIASYEKNEIIYLSTSDSLTKIDGNSSETYDALVDRRKVVADGITELGSRITNYNLMINDLLSSTSHLQPDDAKAASQEDDPEAAEGEGAIDNAYLPTPEELAEAEGRLSSQRAMLEENIRTLTADGDTVIEDFRAMLEGYNAQKINELSVSVMEPVYRSPKLVSGSFVVRAIKTTGPIVALGFMVCMILIVIGRMMEEKRK